MGIIDFSNLNFTHIGNTDKGMVSKINIDDALKKSTQYESVKLENINSSKENNAIILSQFVSLKKKFSEFIKYCQETFLDKHLMQQRVVVDNPGYVDIEVKGEDNLVAELTIMNVVPPESFLATSMTFDRRLQLREILTDLNMPKKDNVTYKDHRRSRNISDMEITYSDDEIDLSFSYWDFDLGKETEVDLKAKFLKEHTYDDIINIINAQKTIIKASFFQEEGGARDEGFIHLQGPCEVVDINAWPKFFALPKLLGHLGSMIVNGSKIDQKSVVNFSDNITLRPLKATAKNVRAVRPEEAFTLQLQAAETNGVVIKAQIVPDYTSLEANMAKFLENYNSINALISNFENAKVQNSNTELIKNNAAFRSVVSEFRRIVRDNGSPFDFNSASNAQLKSNVMDMVQKEPQRLKSYYTELVNSLTLFISDVSVLGIEITKLEDKERVFEDNAKKLEKQLEDKKAKLIKQLAALETESLKANQWHYMIENSNKGSK